MEKKINGDGLIEFGRTHLARVYGDNPEPYIAQYEVKGGKVRVVPNTRYLEHRCPHCGGRIIITSKGYFCENSLLKHPTCNFHCNGILSHRFIRPKEIEAYLAGKPLIIDGCFNSEGKIFSAILEENEKYGMSLTSVVGKCPGCGSNVLVSPVAFNCECNQAPGGCSLKIWRHVKGHAITLDELDELLTDGVTSRPVMLNSRHGSLSLAYLRLSEDKKRVITEPVSIKDMEKFQNEFNLE